MRQIVSRHTARFALLALLAAWFLVALSACSQRLAAHDVKAPAAEPSSVLDKLSADLQVGSYGPYGLGRIGGRVPVVVQLLEGHSSLGGAASANLHLLVAPEELRHLAALDCVARVDLDFEAER